MKKYLSLLFTPALLVGYHFTQHNAFLYVLGVMCVIMVISYALLLVVADQDVMVDLAVKVVPTYTPTFRVASAAVAIGTMVYLLYTSSFIVATIYLIAALFGQFILLLLKSYVK